MDKRSRRHVLVFALAVLLLCNVVLIGWVTFTGDGWGSSLFGPSVKESSDRQGGYYRSGYPGTVLERRTPTVPPGNAFSNECTLCASNTPQGMIFGILSKRVAEPSARAWLGFPEIEQDWVNYEWSPVPPMMNQQFGGLQLSAMASLSGGGGGGSTTGETVVLTPVPEPSTWAMLIAGLLLVGASVKWNRKNR